MSNTKNKLYIIDGNSLLHRAWHAIPELTTQDGTLVNAAYGFAMVLDKIIAEHAPSHLAVCWDLAGGTFRNEIFDEYKAGREKKGPELYDQIDLIYNILDAHGIPSFGVEGYEADDLLGTIAEHERKNPNTETIIITGDLDALQLVDELTKVLVFIKGFSITKTYDIAAVKERYGFGPEHIVDYKSIKGDASDNIPGVKGIGDKGATELIQKVGGLDEIYKALDAGQLEDDFKTGLIKKLDVDRENAYMSHELATIIRDVPMKFKMSDAKMEVTDWEEVRKIYSELEFDGLIKKLERRGVLDIVPETDDAIVAKKVTKATRELEIIISTDEDAVTKMLETFTDEDVLYALDVRNHARDLFGTSITSITVSDGMQSFVFKSPSEKSLKLLSKFVAKRKLVTYDLKNVFHILSEVGLNVSGNGTDLMVASYLVGAGSRGVKLDAVLEDLVGTVAPDSPDTLVTDKDYEVLGKIVSLFVVAETEARKRLEDAEMTQLYDNLEHPLILVLARMEHAGILLDKTALHDMSKKLTKRLDKLTKQIVKYAGHDFNINSPSQLADVLFIDLDLPVKGIKKTKTGYSTAASELEKLSEAHPIINIVSEYRELAKLKSTYVDALPELVAADKRVHSTFNQTVTATGRLSSSNPNLQNIPIRTELGRDIRRAFIADKHRKLIAADYSQVELRLVAAFSKDETMVKTFVDGGDIHKSTAAKVFGVSEDEVTKKQRSSAKGVNFGIIYGMGPRALSKNIGVSFTEAKEFIAKYFEAFPGVRKYLDQSLVIAQDKGYAETMLGRRRVLPELESRVQMIRAAAERMATNMPLQGSAADIIKKAMIDMDAWLTSMEFGDRARMLLQVHDELVLEVDDDLVDEVSRKLKDIMESAVDLIVPLTVDVEIGQNWRDLEEVA